MSDRELDAWLAEHLLNWKYEIPTYGLVYAHGAAQALRHESGFVTPPDLTGSGDGMLLVIEAMRERFGLSVTNIVGLEGASRSLAITVDAESGRWYCEFPEPWEYAEADTLPMAVALAARSALEVADA